MHVEFLVEHVHIALQKNELSHYSVWHSTLHNSLIKRTYNCAVSAILLQFSSHTICFVGQDLLHKDHSYQPRYPVIQQPRKSPQRRSRRKPAKGKQNSVGVNEILAEAAALASTQDEDRADSKPAAK